MRKAIRRYKAPYLFILPFFLLFLAFQLIPAVWTVYISFTDWKGLGKPKFCGLKNYRTLLVDNMFWDSFRNTVIYWLSGFILIMVLAILIAVLLNMQKLKGKTFYKTVTFLPYICASIAVGLIFRMLFDERVGLINEILAALGFSKIGWLTSTEYSRIPVIILYVWRNTPWYTMIIFSGLLNIPVDFYEAATVDGAGAWKQFWYITLPSLKNILFFCSITLTVDTWKMFNESYILPGPGTSNMSLFQYMYQSGFGIFKMGYASAIGVLLIIILGIISFIQFAVRKRQAEI